MCNYLNTQILMAHLNLAGLPTMVESNSILISENKKAEINKKVKEATERDKGHTEELSINR